MMIELVPNTAEDYGLSQKDADAIKARLLASPTIDDSNFVSVISCFKVLDNEVARHIAWQKAADDFLKQAKR
jgi:hypothetical protein